MSHPDAKSFKWPGTFALKRIPTGATMSRQPPEGSRHAPSGADGRRAEHHPIIPKTAVAFPAQTKWLSTTSRPVGLNALSPRLARMGSPPQPPPLPPPPPSPQLIPMKVRLARSQSVTAASTRASKASNRGPWGSASAAARRSAFRYGQSYSLEDTKPESYLSLTSGNKDVNQTVSTMFSKRSPGFPSIKHPSERNVFFVCATSFVFLTIATAITVIFSVLVLPLYAFVFVLRRLNVLLVNLYSRVLCCQCGNTQLLINSNRVLAPIISRLRIQNPDNSQLCQCWSGEIPRSTSLRLLTPAELRWLPSLEALESHSITPVYLPSDSPFIVICLRFGAPGIRLENLREVIANRLLTRNSKPPSPTTENHDFRHRAHSLVPPPDALSRLTQCLTCVSLGYAWRECPAFRLEEHVVTLPSDLVEPSIVPLSKSKFFAFKAQRDQPSSVHRVNVEQIVDALSNVPMLWNRPLWKAYLLEQFQEVDDAENSDQDSAAESDDCANETTKSTVSRQTSSRTLSPAFLGQRSGSAGIGSLLVFRLHAALSDDGQTLVRLITNCLTDTQISHASFNEGLNRQKWRGPAAHRDKSQLTTLAADSVDPSSKMKSSVNSKSESSTSSPKTSSFQHDGTVPMSPEVQPASSRSSFRKQRQSTSSEDDDLEESEAAQWWYAFWSSSMATVASCCDLVRAIVTGPAIILHKYFFTQADMGIVTKPHGKTMNEIPRVGRTRIHKSTVLSLVKLNRVSQVTKASYSEIILSLLAGGIRAYHQTVGLQHPPDLLSFLTVEVPKIPNCSAFTQPRYLHPQSEFGGCEIAQCPGIRKMLVRRQMKDDYQTGSVFKFPAQYITPNPKGAENLRPGRYVLADICLPLNTEGVLPRLWQTRHRLMELKNSVDPLCLAWARTFLYTSLPHPVANQIEATFGSSAKASVSVTGIDVVSPFNRHHSHSSDNESPHTYQMPPIRRLAYMTLLANKSAEARGSHRQTRRRSITRGQPRQGTSFRALAKHLANANAGLVFIAKSPVVRVDTWMPSPNVSKATEASTTELAICRDLSVTFTTYAGQLSITFSVGVQENGSYPDVELMLKAMRTQLRSLCTLLSGRSPPTSTGRWLSQTLTMERTRETTAMLHLSPSLNPSVVLRDHASGDTSRSVMGPTSSKSASAKNLVATQSPTSSSHIHSTGGLGPNSEHDSDVFQRKFEQASNFPADLTRETETGMEIRQSPIWEPKRKLSGLLHLYRHKRSAETIDYREEIHPDKRRREHSISRRSSNASRNWNIRSSRTSTSDR